MRWSYCQDVVIQDAPGLVLQPRPGPKRPAEVEPTYEGLPCVSRHDAACTVWHASSKRSYAQQGTCAGQAWAGRPSRSQLQHGRHAASAWEGQQCQRIRQHGCHVTLHCTRHIPVWYLGKLQRSRTSVGMQGVNRMMSSAPWSSQGVHGAL